MIIICDGCGIAAKMCLAYCYPLLPAINSEAFTGL
jgi:hypothetical protein